MAQNPTAETREHHLTRRKGVKLTCPTCSFRIGDVSPNIRMIVRLAEDDPLEPADLYLKCVRCKAEIAARKIE